MRGPVIVTLKDCSFKRSKPGGRNHVDARIAGRLASIDGERSRVAKLRTAAANRHNVGIAGQPDSQVERRVRRECRAGTAARQGHRDIPAMLPPIGGDGRAKSAAMKSSLCDQPSRIATGRPGKRPSSTLTISSWASMTLIEFRRWDRIGIVFFRPVRRDSPAQPSPRP